MTGCQCCCGGCLSTILATAVVLALVIHRATPIAALVSSAFVYASFSSQSSELLELELLDSVQFWKHLSQRLVRCVGMLSALTNWEKANFQPQTVDQSAGACPIPSMVTACQVPVVRFFTNSQGLSNSLLRIRPICSLIIPFVLSSSPLSWFSI